MPATGPDPRKSSSLFKSAAAGLPNSPAVSTLRKTHNVWRGVVALEMVEESNTAAQALYRKEGYKPVGTSRDYYGRGQDGIWMQKTRTPDVPPKIRV